MRCYICGETATCKVTVTYSTTGKRPTVYRACDDHEPRHIPGADVAHIKTEMI